MGYEARCRVGARDLAGGEQTGDAKVMLETDELIARGDVRLRIPRASITAVDAADGRLTVRHAAGVAVFALGDAAPKWAARLTAPPKSLLDKLEVADGAAVSVVGVDDPDFLVRLAERTPRLSRGRLKAGSDAIFLAVERDGDLAKIARAATALKPTGALWVVHRKGPAGVRDTAIFAAAKEAGLTYTKVVRFSDTHTAEKLVVPQAVR